MAAPSVLPQCLAATQQHRRSTTHRKGTVRQLHGSARREAYHDGQEGRRGAERARLPGKTRRGGNQVVARRVVRDGERSPSCPGRRTTRGAAGAERLAGQMSRDTPRLPHATAREYASTGNTAPRVRDLAILTGTGSPISTHQPPLPAAVAAAERGFSNPKRTVRKALRRTFAAVRFSTMLRTFPLIRAPADSSVGARTHVPLRGELGDDAPTALRPAAAAEGRPAGFARFAPRPGLRPGARRRRPCTSSATGVCGPGG